MIKKNVQRLLVLVCAIVVITLVHKSGLIDDITLAKIKKFSHHLKRYVTHNHLKSLIVFQALFITATVTALPITLVLTVAAGYLFGTVFGTLYVLVGAAFGSLVIAAFAQYIFGETIQKSHMRALQKFNNEMQRSGHWYLLMIQFLPATPSFLVSVFAGITEIPFATIAWTTMLGILPHTLLYTWSGNKLRTLKSLNDVLSWQVVGLFIVLACLSLVPIIINWFKKRDTVA